LREEDRVSNPTPIQVAEMYQIVETRIGIPDQRRTARPGQTIWTTLVKILRKVPIEADVRAATDFIVT
jgi:hypothetical protein